MIHLPEGIEWAAAILPVGDPYMALLGEHSSQEAWHIPVSLDPWAPSEDGVLLSRKETYGWKPQVRSSNGRLERSLGEVELAERLRSQGFRAYWVDSFGSAPETWKAWAVKPDQLPQDILALDREIRAHPLMQPFRRGGLPDVVAWRQGQRPLFVEYKGPSGANPRKEDRIQASQDAWIRAALALGTATRDSFVVAKWIPDEDAAAILMNQKQLRER